MTGFFYTLSISRLRQQIQVIVIGSRCKITKTIDSLPITMYYIHRGNSSICVSGLRIAAAQVE